MAKVGYIFKAAGYDGFFEYDFKFPLFGFCIDSTLNKPLYMIFIFVYGGKVKYKSLYNNTLK